MTVIMLSFRSQGKEKEAESLLRNSIHFGPYFADAYSSLASLYAEQVKPPEIPDSELCAVERLMQILHGVIVLYCLIFQKRFAEAKEMYLKGIERCPENSDLHNNYGVFLVDTGQTISADHFLIDLMHDICFD